MGKPRFFITRIHFWEALSKQVVSYLAEMYQQQDTGITEAHQADVSQPDFAYQAGLWQPDFAYQHGGPTPGEDIPQRPRAGRRVTRRGQANRRSQEELNHAGVGYLAPETLINATQPAFAVLLRGLSTYQQEACKKIRQRGLNKMEARKSRKRKDDELEDLKMLVQAKLALRDFLKEESERLQEELLIERLQEELLTERFHHEPITEEDFQ